MATFRTNNELAAAETLHFPDASFMFLDLHALAELQEDTAPVTNFPFFRLPVELRIMILGLYFKASQGGKSVIQRQVPARGRTLRKPFVVKGALPQSMWYPRRFWRPSVSLFLLDHHMHEEAARVLYGNNRLFLNVASVWSAKVVGGREVESTIEYVAPRYLSMIKDLTV